MDALLAGLRGMQWDWRLSPVQRVVIALEHRGPIPDGFGTAAGRSATAKLLAAELGVSTRTLERLLSVLRSARELGCSYVLDWLRDGTITATRADELVRAAAARVREVEAT